MADRTQQRAAEIFKACLDIEPALRATFIDDQCRGNTSLCREVESLLKSDSCATEFLETPPQKVQPFSSAGSNRLIGRIIGGYKVERLLASGGMGTVYEATHQRLGRPVALKVVRYGSASPEILRRFEFEARLLARLRHSAIAQIYEVGTYIDHEGVLGPANCSVPFFAMEYVANARTIIDFVRDERLSANDRLMLFAQVCDAVHYGHQHGVIHRDLKPSNILVGNDRSKVDLPLPKVIDFGVARASDGDAVLTTLHTSYGQLIGTLQYMSPEQCVPTLDGGEPLDIDVRSDIYSLGLVLYELLCGEPPYSVQKMTLLEATQVIREQPPPRLSAINRSFRGDLETIVRKALEKEREHRYQTAGELSDDVRRFLAKEPILARPPSLLYQFLTLARRNRAVVAGVAAVFLVLIAGVATTSWQAVRAREFAKDAKSSEHVANLRLRESLVAQARSTRLTGLMGQRFDSLNALEKSAKIESTTDARSEAIAAMALPDLRVASSLKRQGASYFDATLERFAGMDSEKGEMTVVRVSDESELAKIPAPSTGWVNILWVSLVGRYLTRAYDVPDIEAIGHSSRRLELWLLPVGLDVTRTTNTDGFTNSIESAVPLASLHMEFDDMTSPGRHDISPDGKRLAVGRSDRAVHIYDLSSRQEIQRIAVDRDPSYLTFDHSGHRLVLYHGNYQSAEILNLDTGQTEPAFESHSITWSVAWHPDGDLLAGGCGVQIELWNSKDHQSVGQFVGHQAQIVQVQFSNDGTRLLSYSWDGVAFLWDARTLRPLLRCNVSWPVFSPDGEVVAGVTSGHQSSEVQLFELDAALERRTLCGSAEQQPFFVSMHGAFVHDDRFLVTGENFAEQYARYRAFDVATGREVAVGNTGAQGPLAVDPLGRFFLTGNKDGVYRWPIKTVAGNLTVGASENVFPSGPISTLEFMANGDSIAVGGYSAQEFAILDLRESGAVRRIECPVKGGIQFSPDGRWATVITGKGSGMEVRDLQTETIALELAAASAAFSPDGRWLAVSDTDGLCIREVGSWRVLQRGARRFGHLRFSPDSRMLVNIPGLNVIELIDTLTLARIAILEPPENFYTINVAFSEDGSLLAQLTNHAGFVHVWDLRKIRAKLHAMGLDWE